MGASGIGASRLPASGKLRPGPKARNEPAGGPPALHSRPPASQGQQVPERLSAPETTTGAAGASGGAARTGASGAGATIGTLATGSGKGTAAATSVAGGDAGNGAATTTGASRHFGERRQSRRGGAAGKAGTAGTSGMIGHAGRLGEAWRHRHRGCDDRRRRRFRRLSVPRREPTIASGGQGPRKRLQAVHGQIPPRDQERRHPPGGNQTLQQVIIADQGIATYRFTDHGQINHAEAQKPVGQSGLTVEQARAEGNPQPLAELGGKAVGFRGVAHHGIRAGHQAEDQRRGRGNCCGRGYRRLTIGNCKPGTPGAAGRPWRHCRGAGPRQPASAHRRWRPGGPPRTAGHSGPPGRASGIHRDGPPGTRRS